MSYWFEFQNIDPFFVSTKPQSIYLSMVHVLNILTTRRETFNWKPPFLVHMFEMWIAIYLQNSYIS